MKSAGSLIVAASLLLAVGAQALDAQAANAADNPYASIVARNMFGLLPLPPPDTNGSATPVDPPPKITPNGIMTIFGRVEALFKVAVKPKPGQQPVKDQAYVLSEGERQDDIEVVKINQVDSIVTFNNHGAIQELPLVLAANTTAPAGGPGGRPGAGPRNPIMGGQRPGSSPMYPAGRPAMPTMGGRPAGPGMNPSSLGTSPAQSNPGQPGLGANNFQPQSSFQPQNNTPPQSIEDQVMNAAQQMAIIEQNRIATQEAVNQGVLPPLPPTLLTPPDATAFGGTPLIAPTPAVPVPPPPR